MTPEQHLRRKRLHTLIPVLLGLVIWFLPAPEGITPQAWHLLAVFVATIVGIILKPYPIGAVAFMGLCALTLTKTLSFADAFSGFSSPVVWLIVFAFFVARGFIKTGLGSRISYKMMMLLGKKTLGLAYGFVLTDFILSPAIPSSTARSGGIIFPVVDSLAKLNKSNPHHPSARRMGSFLISVLFQSTCITSAMFLTSMAANPLVAEIAAGFGLEITWGKWALAAIVPGIVSLIVVPYLIYKIYPPGIKETPEAAAFALQQLEEMGPMKRQEWIMLSTFGLLVFLWAFGPTFGINAAIAALTGMVILLLAGILEWRDISHEGEAWETLIWFAILLTMASQMNTLGLTAWFSNWAVLQVQDFDPFNAFIILSIVYFYSHYFFASNVAHVGAMYAGFLTIIIALGAPAGLASLVLAFFSALYGGLTHYGCGPAAVLFGAGYVPVGAWWRVGFVVSVANVFIWLVIGGAWWKFLGIW